MNKDDFIKMIEDGYKLLTREETLEEKSFRVGYKYAVNKMFDIVMNGDKEIERLHSIIKEVREYIESNPLVYIYDTDIYVTDIEFLEKNIPELKFIRTLNEILDKVGEINDYS